MPILAVLILSLIPLIRMNGALCGVVEDLFLPTQSIIHSLHHQVYNDSGYFETHLGVLKHLSGSFNVTNTTAC